MVFGIISDWYPKPKINGFDSFKQAWLHAFDLSPPPLVKYMYSETCCLKLGCSLSMHSFSVKLWAS